VAEVCAGALEATGFAVDTRDCMRLLGTVQATMADSIYRLLISRPAIYDGFHFAHLRAEGRLSRGGDDAAAKRIIRNLERPRPTDGLGPVRLADLDLVLAVFATGARVGAELVRRHRSARSVVYCTDATVHRMWVHEGTDLFVATCELAAKSVLRYQPGARVVVVPPAVRGSFFGVPSQAAARERFDVPEGATCVLLVSGGWGIGPVAQSARALAKAGHHVLAVSGSNRRLRNELDTLAVEDPRIHSLGLTDEMPAAMAASDVVVSGAGQTCHEVRVVGRPLVVLDAVPGHGRENLLHEMMSGGAATCSPTAESVVGVVEATLRSGERPPPWPVASPEEWRACFLAALAPLGL
jgi:hypothetical protein